MYKVPNTFEEYLRDVHREDYSDILYTEWIEDFDADDFILFANLYANHFKK